MKLQLYWKVIIGLVLGIFWTIISSYIGLTEFTANWIAPFGRIFISLLKLIAIPLVLFTIIGGIVSLGSPKNLGILGVKTLLLYISTTLVAVSIGLILVNVIEPGKFIDDSVRTENRIRYEIWAQNNNIEIKDRQCLLCDTTKTVLIARITSMNNLDVSESVQSKVASLANTKESGPLQFIEDMVPSNIFSALQDSKGMLKVIFFALFFGIALLYLPVEKQKPLMGLINGMSETFLKMVDITMKASPFFVFALMAGLMSEMTGGEPSKLFELFIGLGTYSLTVIVGLFLMIFLVYPLILKVFVRKISILGFFKGIGTAQALAFSSSSSAATLPVTIECVEQNLWVRKKISGFVLPIGATINMDGTSLYQSVAVVFLAQMYGVELSFDQQLLIVITATLASIGSAAVPSAGLVMLMVVLNSVGLNPAWIAVILPVDRILDMIRTVVNVTGDAAVATVVDRISDIE